MTLTLATVYTGQTHQGFNGNGLGKTIRLEGTKYSINIGLLDIYLNIHLEHLSSPPTRFALLLEEWKVRVREGGGGGEVKGKEGKQTGRPDKRR